MSHLQVKLDDTELEDHNLLCSAEFTHAMALNGKHASMLRGQQRVNERYLKRNMSSVWPLHQSL